MNEHQHERPVGDAGEDLPICVTCGVQYGRESSDANHCRICEDERQYVGWDGQRWTTQAELRGYHRNRIEAEGPGVWGVGTVPSFGIGQRALLLQPGRGRGNVLWDCISLVDDDTVAFVHEHGGVDVIAISHPHFYGAMVDWSRALGGVPVCVHERDREWITRPDPGIELWSGDTLELGPGLTLINCGIHFEGGTVLHWAGAETGTDEAATGTDEAGEAGALLSGDILQVVMDRRWVSFMRSYPNLIPEDPRTIERALRLLEPFPYRRIYGAFWGRVVSDDGPGVVTRSARRYLRWVGSLGRAEAEPAPVPDSAPG